MAGGRAGEVKQQKGTEGGKEAPHGFPASSSLGDGGGPWACRGSVVQGKEQGESGNK